MHFLKHMENKSFKEPQKIRRNQVEHCTAEEITELSGSRATFTLLLILC